MLGWEFPPFISGGLGTACYGLTRGLDEVGVEVCFVLPTAVPVGDDAPPAPRHVQLRSPADLLPEGVHDDLGLGHYTFEHLEVHRLAAKLVAYGQPTRETTRQLEVVRQQARRDAAKDVLRKALKKANRVMKSADVPLSGNIKSPEANLKLPKGSMVLGGAGVHYEGDLFTEIYRYAELAVQLASVEQFDVIHAHDWMTYAAGMAVAAATGKPLVVHLHSTEFDRSGVHVNQRVYDIERAGMHMAEKVLCVSYLTANIARSRYGVPTEKVEVIYNAVDLPSNGSWQMAPIRRDEKIVLFLGRVTMQKGPEYFLQAAARVVQKYRNVRFVMAGSGDMIQRCIQMAADLRIGRYVTFTGFLRGGDVGRIFEMADLYVMPSVSEPFGIAPLEALSHNVPVIISRQSGVSEVLTHVLKVDFWDTEEMANKILAVLRHEPLQRTLRTHGHFELEKFSWKDSAKKVKDVYESIVPDNN
jgi:glycosyltransferase involved in cell wall biosynthesis